MYSFYLTNIKKLVKSLQFNALAKTHSRNTYVFFHTVFFFPCVTFLIVSILDFPAFFYTEISPRKQNYIQNHCSCP